MSLKKRTNSVGTKINPYDSSSGTPEKNDLTLD